MYTAVIACGLACAWAGSSAWGWPCVAALVIVLLTKAIFEERRMVTAHPAYAAYQAGTYRFLPWIL